MGDIFLEHQSIYRQIAEKIKDQLLQAKLSPGDKLPSLREQAIELEVNIHTITKGYNLLENDGMIEKRRGLGFFVTNDAYQQVLAERKQRFKDETIPRIKREMDLLNMSVEDLHLLLKEPLE